MKGELEKYLIVAKAAVYNEQRAPQYLQMMETRGGAIQCALSILAAIEAKQPIPAQIKPMLVINIYLMLVDLAMAASGNKPDKEMMKQTIGALLEQIGTKPGQQQQAQQPQQAPQPAQPQGLLAGAV